MKLIQKVITDIQLAVKTKQFYCYLGIIIFIVVVDQISKWYVHAHFYLGESVPVIANLFNLTYVRNTGAAFGFGGQFHDVFRIMLFLILPVFLCFWLFVLLIESFNKHILLRWSYALILGGAFGNLIDRFQMGFVVDFFDFYYQNAHFATFNVADSAITLGAILLIIENLFLAKKIEKNPQIKNVT